MILFVGFILSIRSFRSLFRSLLVRSLSVQYLDCLPYPTTSETLYSCRPVSIPLLGLAVVAHCRQHPFIFQPLVGVLVLMLIARADRRGVSSALDVR